MSSIFSSSPIPNGHSWTIVSKLGHILQTAEARYGERDKSCTILGMEISTQAIPQIWYPENCKNAVIQITVNCANDINRAVYQVAHEAIHFLSLTGGANSNYLEEGLATHFSIEYTLNNGHGIWHSGDPKYDEALKLVEQLFLIDPNIIKTLRHVEPTISLITRELLTRTNSNITQDLADKLTRKF
jgi:hypothetical protein